MALALTISIPRSTPQKYRDLPKRPPDQSTFCVQKDTPGADKESNWLPAQAMPRMYWPKESDPSVYPGPAGEIVTPEEQAPARSGLRSVPGLEPTNRRVIDSVGN